MPPFGMHVKFTAQSGKRDTLLELLLEAASAMESVPECRLYFVNVTDTEPDTIWVTEVWNDEAAHQASLADEATKAAIQQAMPLIAGVEAIRYRPVGGKGL
ncbi:putative quinol monooxygenase [Paenibacillus koleovorans]|uniref:putative quinol monooxygenase n=1 Tax=Paenibacillus koleovorans TaxID=121608 RepID=UPI000FD8ECD7|nr:antibiotic biosynthesis monooxygenase [Paenibacillus koleovorans]